MRRSTDRGLQVSLVREVSPKENRGDKFNDYPTLGSLQDYLLINTKHQRVEIFSRHPQGWILQTYAEGSFPLQSLDLSIPLADLYEDVDIGGPPRRQQIRAVIPDPPDR